jgi:hypothetical protein
LVIVEVTKCVTVFSALFNGMAKMR